MQKYFEISAERMRTICGIEESRIFPVTRIENNMTGGAGFDTYVFLDTGDGYYKNAYIGQQEMFAARGRFVTEADYLAQCAADADSEKRNMFRPFAPLEVEEVETIVAQPVADEWMPEEDADAWKARDAERIAVAQARGVSLSLVERIAAPSCKFWITACDDARNETLNTVRSFGSASHAMAWAKSVTPAAQHGSICITVSLDKPAAPECVCVLHPVEVESNAVVLARAVAVVRANRITREYVAACAGDDILSGVLAIAPFDVVTLLAQADDDARRTAEYLAVKDGDEFTIAVDDGGSGSWPFVVRDRDADPIARFSYRGDAEMFKGEKVRALAAEQARADAARLPQSTPYNPVFPAPSPDIDTDNGDDGSDDPDNDDRALWAQHAVMSFARITRMDTAGEDNQTIVTDLLADLMHFADRNNVNWLDAIAHAVDHYNVEKAEEEPLRRDPMAGEHCETCGCALESGQIGDCDDCQEDA